jgi:hypothetical protein
MISRQRIAALALVLCAGMPRAAVAQAPADSLVEPPADSNVDARPAPPDTAVATPAAAGPAGDLVGEVRDAATEQPLPYARVEVPALGRAVLAGRDGWFVVPRVPPGTYTLQAGRVGYAALELLDVRVRAGKSTQLVIELDKRELRAAPVVVRSDPYAGRTARAGSELDLSYEEVRRAPGSAADVSRTVQALPGVTHTSDQTSELVVRGGAPSENLTLLDDVPIPNANHFPEYGGAGGAISMLNTELVRGVSFYTGGFPIQHGDKLSSVLEVKLRDGNRRQFGGDLDLSLAGAGLVLEGPFAGGKGSYLVNGRRSYVDLIVERVNSSTVPRYSDLQGKILWQPDARNTLTLVGLAGFDRVTLDEESDAYSRGFDFVDARQTQYAAGLTWKRLLAERGHSIVTVHRSENNFGYDIRDRLRRGAAPDSVYFSDSFEAETGVRARGVVRLGGRTDLTFGGEARRVRFSHRITASADTLQEALPTARPDSVRLVAFAHNDVRVREAATKGALFAGVERRLGARWTATAGLRWDRFDFGGQEALSPRGGLLWRGGERWTARASAGVFHQTPVSVLLTQTVSNRRLPYARALHGVVGADWRLSRAALATVEVFAKRYRRLPVAAERGSYELFPDGTGDVRGLEIFLQQRLLARWYGLASYSWSRSERTDRVYGTYRDDWDAPHVLTLLGGVRPGRGFELSARWRYLSGRPYTRFAPRFEVAPDGSVTPGSGYWIGFERAHNGDRLPAYHRLDLRVDHRAQLGRFHLVTFLDLENIYDRGNVLTQRYSHDAAAPEAVFQWQLLPVVGLSLEF